MGDATSIDVRLAIRTHNPNNGATGNSRLAGILKAKRRKLERTKMRTAIELARGVRPLPERPWIVAVTRVAPSSGLDPHDGLGAALKGCIDGIADALGLKNDRDPNVEWRLRQRRGVKGEYAVEVAIWSSGTQTT